MSREQRVRDLIARWQPRLGLQAWDIRYIDGAWKKRWGRDRLAYLRREDNQLAAQVYIHDNAPDSHLEALLLHELVHIVLRDLVTLAQRSAGMAGDAAPVLMDTIHDFTEKVCDDFSYALCGVKSTYPGAYDKARMTAFGERYVQS